MFFKRGNDPRKKKVGPRMTRMGANEAGKADGGFVLFPLNLSLLSSPKAGKQGERLRERGKRKKGV
jgi:hypothetical protein